MNQLTDSILLTVKKMLGIAEEYHAFDIDIVVNINSIFLTLNQLGVGPKTPFQISGDAETWADFLGDQKEDVVGVPTYVYLKTRLLFDPPTNSFLVDAMQSQVEELEWRLNFQAEGGGKSGDNEMGSENQPDKSENLPDPFDDELDEFGTLHRSRESEARLLRAAWHQGPEMGSS